MYLHEQEAEELVARLVRCVNICGDRRVMRVIEG